MRRALGAGRPRLAAQFLSEALLLSFAGALVGLALGGWGAGALSRAMPPSLLPPYVDVTPDGRVFTLAAALMTLVALVTGVIPAYLSARSDLSHGMRERGTVGVRGRSRLQGLLVAGEVALALVLLIGAGLMTRSLGAQLAVDPGFDAERLLAFRVDLPASRYPDAESNRVAFTELLDRLRAGPGVSGVAFSSDAPLRGYASATILFTGDGTDDRVRFYRHMVEPAFFETLGIEIEQGSGFEGFDAAASGDVAVISRAMAERHFSGVDPVGRTLFLGGNRLPLTVIGVAEDVRWRDLTTDLVGGPTDPDVYLPWARFPGGSVDVLLRTSGDPASLIPWAREVVQGFDPELPLVNVQPMTEALRIQTAQGRFGSVLLAAFSAVAVLLAAVGLYGVLSFAVGRRTREFAVRMAMGARAEQVRRMVVVDGLRLAAFGVIAGALIASQAARALQTFLFRVEAGDPATYALTVLLVALVAAVAAWIPAHRATRVQPQTALTE
jgi:predicted permease